MWGFLDKKARFERKELSKALKERQIKGLKRMKNPSLWTKIKFCFWKQYWKYLMPDYINVKYTVFGPYFYVKNKKGEIVQIKARNNLTIKEIKSMGKLYRKHGK